MFNSNQIAIAAVPPRECDRAVRYSHHGAARRRCVIGCEMRPLRTQDGMHTPGGEAGTDTGSKLQRRCEYRTFQRNTLFGIVGVIEQKPSITMASVHQLRSLNLSVLYEVTIVQ